MTTAPANKLRVVLDTNVYFSALTHQSCLGRLSPPLAGARRTSSPPQHGGSPKGGRQLSLERPNQRKVRPPRLRPQLPHHRAGYGDIAGRCKAGGSGLVGGPFGKSARAFVRSASNSGLMRSTRTSEACAESQPSTCRRFWSGSRRPPCSRAPGIPPPGSGPR